ncbi:hypothetical protein A0H81_00013 [Grifola frondosa]|uniref:Uncharacterized protein n=1 Tax=Grifola frondosa TaxID=5627 RepID=A0A1C7MRB1_GRIFR|nr:hypothetical protein A0H81_00013 [Grifola frondosa]
MDSSTSPSVLSKSEAPDRHRRTVRALLATANEHTAGWATHIIIFGSFGVVLTAAMKRLLTIPRHEMWETRRTVATAIRLKRELAEDDNLRRIQAVANEVHDVDWRNKATHAAVDPPESSLNNGIAPDFEFSDESISSKIVRLTSRTWSTSATRQHFAAVLQPYLQHGSLSPYDYDVGVTQLSHVSNDSIISKFEGAPSRQPLDYLCSTMPHSA